MCQWKKSTYTIHLYKYKNTRIGFVHDISIIFFPLQKYCMCRLWLVAVGLFILYNNNNISRWFVLHSARKRAWPMYVQIMVHGGTDPRTRTKKQCGPLPHGQVAKPKQIKRARQKTCSRRGVRPVAR